MRHKIQNNLLSKRALKYDSEFDQYLARGECNVGSIDLHSGEAASSAAGSSQPSTTSNPPTRHVYLTITAIRVLYM